MAKQQPPSVTNPSLAYLHHLGPHRTATGPLDPAGLAGLVVTPSRGRDLPVIALMHAWLLPPERYLGTMRYLASWGFVAVAPRSGRGPIPSHAQMSTDLRRAVDAVGAARLGSGSVTVDPTSCGVLGHGIGGGVATLAAAAQPTITAVFTVAAAPTRPCALTAAGRLTVPSLHLAAADDEFAADTPAQLAAAWAGPTQLREVARIGHLALAEGKRFTDQLLGKAAFAGAAKAQTATRILATAFFLRHLAGHQQLAEALTGKVAGTKPAPTN